MRQSQLWVLQTSITIQASPQTVWAVLEDFDSYPEWNSILPEIRGLAVVGETLAARLALENTPPHDFSPLLTTVIAARELRWKTVTAGDESLVAEHYFLLSATEDGGTSVEHCESFAGSIAEAVWPHMDTVGRSSYERMNRELKARAESMMGTSVAIHPLIDSNVSPAAETHSSTLRCHCTANPVVLRVDGPIYHTHLCGCSRCWRPEAAVFALTAVVPAGRTVLESGRDKLQVVDAAQPIKRYRCRDCGVHVQGLVDDKAHHFYGLEFIHPELTGGVVPPVEFAGFVSSLVESGTNPAHMERIRGRLSELRMPVYDGLSAEFMDIIAWHKRKLARFFAQR